MGKRLLEKPIWGKALGASRKEKILKLIPNLYACPVNLCDSKLYHSQRGCKKHVYNTHDWYYYFDVFAT